MPRLSKQHDSSETEYTDSNEDSAFMLLRNSSQTQRRHKAEERKSATEHKKNTDFSIEEPIEADSTSENENSHIRNDLNQVSKDENNQEFYWS
ncbi:4834_t:CDS:2 [Funneliformis caledonium]|uniref:4834_t:CDS:1 n=1 Tax=Funneliformis caledonium TaxID=1117310 RepID=A0A9N8V869_9GLOM|nr:4834_t:CDS:2 [Funneliformis caledonium]